MKARAKTAIGIVLLGLGLGEKAVAQDIPASATKKKITQNDVCFALAHYDLVKTSIAFSTFSMPIFGKHPERWTMADVQNLFANVRECNGKPKSLVPQSQVSLHAWKQIFNDDLISKTLAVSTASTEMAKKLKPNWPSTLKMPYCADLLTWKRDPVWLVNNSSDIFGSRLYSITDEAAGAVKNLINGCRPVVDAILKARGGHIKNAKAILDDIITSVERDQAAQRWAKIEFVPQFRIEHDGAPIPFSYIGKNTQEVLLRLNTSEKNGIPLNEEELAAISTWAKEMIRNSEIGPDAEYVRAIRNVVASQLFSQSTQSQR